ncbi:PilZ domain-containing protein [Polaromonas sp.]|uniref:PilZ domain-containing protein n=1 Tax=Polaromonas sp. TaxID=1869339 RepID=UPI003567EBC4
MEFSAGNERKARVVEQRSAQRFALALRLTVDGGEGATHDLSATGLYFESERRYEVGERIELVLEFPGGKRVYPLTCEAQVVRVSAVGAGFNIAVRLLTPLFSDAA